MCSLHFQTVAVFLCPLAMRVTILMFQTILRLCHFMWGQGLARGRQLQVPTPPPAVHCFPLSLRNPRLGVPRPGILLLSLWVKLGESLRFAQRSLRCPRGMQCLKEIALPFSNSMPRLQSICGRHPQAFSPVLLPYRPVKKITVERSYHREVVKHKSQKWWWPHSTSAILKAIEETWLCLVTFLDLLFKWSIVFKCQKSTFSEDPFFHSPWKPSVPQKEVGKMIDLTSECSLSEVCLLYLFALQYGFQFEHYLFRKAFSCWRAIRKFETVDKEEFLGLHWIVFCTPQEIALQSSPRWVDAQALLVC